MQFLIWQLQGDLLVMTQSAFSSTGDLFHGYQPTC